MFRAVHLNPVSADIDSPAVGIPGYDTAGCADVPPAILLVMDGHREFLEINSIVAINVFQHRPIGDGSGRNGVVLPDSLSIGIEHGTAITGY